MWCETEQLDCRRHLSRRHAPARQGSTPASRRGALPPRVQRRQELAVLPRRAHNGWILNRLIDQVGGGRVSCGGNTNEGPLLYLSLALVNIRRNKRHVHEKTRVG